MTLDPADPQGCPDSQEDLTPDVRITSERRLQSLQIEIAKTTTSNLEQKMVTRYRGVKFFGVSSLTDLLQVIWY